MPVFSKPNAKTSAKTITACIDNASRLIHDAQWLEYEKPQATRLYLILIAQEELAKAFILVLISLDVCPMSRPIYKAMNDHTCKHLVGMIMDYMIAHWDIEDMSTLQRMLDEDYGMEDDEFPIEIASAMEILRYEKIAGWETRKGFYDGDFVNGRIAREVSQGKLDRRKQDALYVRINPDGSVKSTPNAVNDSDVSEEVERVVRYLDFVRDMQAGTMKGRRFDKAMAALRTIFGQFPPI